MSEQDNILPIDGGKKNLSEDKLLAYLEGKLSPAEQHEVEQWLADEGMESDAIEGLRTINAEETKQSVNKVNYRLIRTLSSKKRRRKPLQNEYLTWIAIGLILFLAVVAYIVIRKSMR